MHNLHRYLYSLTLYLLTPIFILRLLWRSYNTPGYRHRISERFGYLSKLPPQHGIWVHAVSFGEVQAAIPLLKQILTIYPQLPLVVTTTTPSGSQRLLETLGSQVYHCYAPYDVPWAVRRFLSQVQPSYVIIMETEIWPNILYQCHYQHIPVLLANARLSAKSAHGYAKLQALTQATLGYFTKIAAQTSEDAQRFVQLGANTNNIEITCNIKFDLSLDPDIGSQAATIRQLWGKNRPIWIAASTHAGEEEQVLDAHQQILSVLPNTLLVLVPRHIERCTKIASLITARGWNVTLRSQATPCAADTKVFLGDSMGELIRFFAAADVALIGGSLIPHGGHNLLEPAAVGIPAITGPYVMNFKEITQMMVAANAAVQVTSVAELVTVVINWLQNQDLRNQIGTNGRLLVERNRGALAKLLQIINSLIK
ncbi:3-deoxy-D-manno-octulosonic acid transferase [Achromatium sp. WMS2]|nr:3-deoxy-D-manno-octulosonic acid transferase [Achromatium sp. WMS2]